MKILFTKQAKKYYEKAPANLQAKFDKALDDLLEDQGDVRPMIGMPGIYRLRIGNYRIIFQPNIETDEYIILKIGPRGGVYKQ